jgi:hypothetical protein
MLMGRIQSSVLMHNLKVCTQYRLPLNGSELENDEASSCRSMYKLVLKMRCTYTARALYIHCTEQTL